MATFIFNIIFAKFNDLFIYWVNYLFINFFFFFLAGSVLHSCQAEYVYAKRFYCYWKWNHWVVLPLSKLKATWEVTKALEYKLSTSSY